MPRITVDLVDQSPQFTNPVRDRELDLRGNKIAVIENLGASLDQFDTFDLSDNDIRKVEGFPLLRRLKMLIINNNQVCRIAPDLDESVPNLEWLILTNNAMEELGDIDPLASLKKLTYLSLMRNPVTHKPHYRSYVIYKLPQLRVLDFRRIRLKERELAKEMFASAAGQEILHQASKRSNTFVPGEPTTPVGKQKPVGPTAEEIAAIKAAIANAKSLEEVKQLEMQLMAGQVPRPQQEPPPPFHGTQKVEEQVVEEDDDDDDDEAEEAGMQT